MWTYSYMDIYSLFFILFCFVVCCLWYFNTINSGLRSVDPSRFQGNLSIPPSISSRQFGASVYQLYTNLLVPFPGLPVLASSPQWFPLYNVYYHHFSCEFGLGTLAQVILPACLMHILLPCQQQT